MFSVLIVYLVLQLTAFHSSFSLPCGDGLLNYIYIIIVHLDLIFSLDNSFDNTLVLV